MRQWARVTDVLLTRPPPQVALTEQAGRGSGVLKRSMSRSKSAAGQEGVVGRECHALGERGGQEER